MSLLETATPPAMPKNYLIKALLVGASKSGKTTSAMTAPGKKLLIDTDGRSQAVTGFKDVDVIKIVPDPDHLAKAWRSLVDLRDEIWDRINDDDFNYDTIIFDGLSSMKRLCMDYCKTLQGADRKLLSTMPGGGPSQAHYGPHIHETDQFINKTLPIPRHIIFTGHYYVFEDEMTNRTEWWPNVFGRGLRNELGSWFDETYGAYREREDGQYKHYWQTGSDRKLSFLGSTLNKLNKHWKDPIPINFDEEPTGFESLLELRFGKGK